MVLLCLLGNVSIIRAELASSWERKAGVPVWNGNFVMSTSGIEFRQNQICLQAKIDGMVPVLYTETAVS